MINTNRNDKVVSMQVSRLFSIPAGDFEVTDRYYPEIIDFKSPMMIEKGKQYKEDGVIYECIQSSKLPISNKLKDLLGFYVKIIK